MYFACFGGGGRGNWERGAGRARVSGRGRGQVGGRGSCYGTLQTVYSVVLFNISLLKYKIQFIKKERLYKKSQYL